MKFSKRYNLDFDKLSLGALKRTVLYAALTILCLVSAYITIINRDTWYLTCCVGVGFALSFWMKTKMMEDAVRLSALYAVDWALLLLLSFFIDQPLLIILIVTTLSSLYVCFSSMLVKIVATFLFYATYLLMVTDLFRKLTVQTTSDTITVFLLIWFCFLFVNLCVVYVGKLRVERYNFQKSKAREEQLQKAYRELENVTILKERNRIAKDIHDNVGHAITTIIMQTEAAKVSMESDPEKAKRCILAANLQAQSALQQMRNSVHLLSDASPDFDLYSSLLKVVADTTAGTDLNIRAKIDPKVSDLPYHVSLLFYTALKEGLNNGIRHGKATAFLFRMTMSAKGATFLLSDNGQGAENFTPGFGLSSLTEQFAGYNYAADFSSSPDEGFEIRIAPKTRRNV